jgi:hypothetical protein
VACAELAGWEEAEEELSWSLKRWCHDKRSSDWNGRGSKPILSFYWDT